MEKERASRSSQQQFSIYSNKGGIVVKEELPSEKEFTKVVKEKDIAIDEKAKIERNMSLNFDHSVVDGVLAIEQACAPKQSNFSGPINLNRFADQKIVKEKKKSSNQIIVDQKPAIVPPLQENHIVANDLPNSKPEEEHPLIDGTSSEAHTADNSTIGTKETNEQDSTRIQNPIPNEEPTNSTGQESPGTSEKPVSPSKESTNNQEAPSRRSSVNTGTSDLNLNSSVPSTPSSPVPNSGSISNLSETDSTSTSARSFAFPVLQREWNTSPAKLPQEDKGRFSKCRGCSAFFCC